jgi:5-bromo-4-chloroindolyl phosphate hydrolysis protein
MTMKREERVEALKRELQCIQEDLETNKQRLRRTQDANVRLAEAIQMLANRELTLRLVQQTGTLHPPART